MENIYSVRSVHPWLLFGGDFEHRRADVSRTLLQARGFPRLERRKAQVESFVRKAKQLSLQLLEAGHLLLGETACFGKKGDESLRTRLGKKKEGMLQSRAMAWQYDTQEVQAGTGLCIRGKKITPKL